MQRYRQTEDQLLSLISPIEVDWRDEHFEAVWSLLQKVPSKIVYGLRDIEELYDIDFDAATTATRLLLDLSKDSFNIAVKNQMDGKGPTKTSFRADRSAYLHTLQSLGVVQALNRIAAQKFTWKDLLAERLKSGRGSAIRGQKRGKALEDFAEELIRDVFGHRFELRCNFLGADGVTEAKCDFAIPSAADPRIVIESKAYGATGSKQTDVLGDVEKIARAKRHDTNFLFVTDGETWRERRSDLRKLITLQNEGRIARIYTQAMRDELLADLRTLRTEHEL